MKRCITFVLFVVFSISAVTFNVARAQDSVSRIMITDILTDETKFPEIVLNALVLDDENIPVRDLSPGMFEITEDGQSVSFEMLQVSTGLNTVLVLDIGKWGVQKIGNETVGSIMQSMALTYIDTMLESDSLSLVAVYGENPVTVMQFTSDKAKLRETVYNLNWKNSSTTFGIEGIVQAQMLLDNLSQGSKKNIVFISPGIMDRSRATNEDRLAASLLSKGIPVFSIHIPNPISVDYSEYFKNISIGTKGLFISTDSNRDIRNIFDALDKYRAQYQFVYRSPSGAAQRRNVVLKHGIPSGASDAIAYTPDPAWIAPFEIEIIVNNNNPIVLKSENNGTPIPIQVEIRNLGNRQIASASFSVNNRRQELNPMGEATYSTIWNISAENYSIGNNSITFTIFINDEFGTEHLGTLPFFVVVESPTDVLCNFLSQFPGIGGNLSSSCVRSGFGLSRLLNIILALAVIGLLVLGWYKRDAVKGVVEAGVRETNRVVDRLTNRLRKQTPKARLIAVQGIAKGERSEFDLFGETPIGRSKEFAHLIFENDNVSRLHCIIHEVHAGYWTIQDQESANHTFVNGVKLEPFVEKEIDTGSSIELGPVEYGGIKFRFEVVDSISEETGVKASAEPNTKVPQAEVRTTKTLKGRTDDIDFDPSDPANQKW